MCVPLLLFQLFLSCQHSIVSQAGWDGFSSCLVFCLSLVMFSLVCKLDECAWAATCTYFAK